MPEQKLNPEALGALYKALLLFMDMWNSGDSGRSSKRAQQRRADMWDKAHAAIALAGSTPAEQPPSGAMTLEKARERARRVWNSVLPGSRIDPWLGLQERISQEFLTIDRAAEKRTLEWLLQLCGPPDYTARVNRAEIERRLKEIEHAG